MGHGNFVDSKIWLCALSVLLACGDSESSPTRDAGSDAQVTEDGSVSALLVACEDKEDGFPCALGRHCDDGKCVELRCGDGIVDPSEECDDGNELSSDSCDPSCKLVGQCGNGTLDKGEECDDGNRVDSDYCTNGCLRQLCRNGVVDPGEECDDNNTNNNDSCSNLCKSQLCGNDVVENGEECDDGNRVDDDACSNKCTKNACGNGRFDIGEYCEGTKINDGTPTGKLIGDGSICSKDCKSVVVDKCRPCEDKWCKDPDLFGNIPDGDLAAACYDSGPADSLVTNFVGKCTAAVRCIRDNPGCDTYVDKTSGNAVGALGCFCGAEDPDNPTQVSSNYITECFKPTTGPHGPCQKPFYSAADVGDGELTEMETFFLEPGRPLFYAVFLAICQNQHCKAECR